jgi:hypothetical protein
METITIRMVRRRDVESKDWLFRETPEGWLVKFGDATLVTEHGKKPRFFTNLGRAVTRLREEVGVKRFSVEVM